MVRDISLSSCAKASVGNMEMAMPGSQLGVRIKEVHQYWNLGRQVCATNIELAGMIVLIINASLNCITSIPI